MNYIWLLCRKRLTQCFYPAENYCPFELNIYYILYILYIITIQLHMTKLTKTLYTLPIFAFIFVKLSAVCYERIILTIDYWHLIIFTRKRYTLPIFFTFAKICFPFVLTSWKCVRLNWIYNYNYAMTLDYFDKKIDISCRFVFLILLKIVLRLLWTLNCNYSMVLDDLDKTFNPAFIILQKIIPCCYEHVFVTSYSITLDYFERHV